MTPRYKNHVKLVDTIMQNLMDHRETTGVSTEALLIAVAIINSSAPHCATHLQTKNFCDEVADHVFTYVLKLQTHLKSKPKH